MATKKHFAVAPPAPETVCVPEPRAKVPARHSADIAKNTHVRGIDISAIQGVVNYAKVLEAPERITFVIFKATDGTKGVDSQAQRNKIELQALNGALVSGCYHVTHPKPAQGLTLERDAEVEAEKCAEWAEGLDLPPMIDFELNELAADKQAAWLKIHAETLEHLTKRVPMIYSGAMMAPTLVMCRKWITKYPLVVANYPQRYLRTSDAGLRIFDRALTFEQAEARNMPTLSPWDFSHGWQFSGGGPGLPGNTIAGINGFVDCDVFSTGAWANLFSAAP